MAHREYHVGDIRYLFLGSGGICYYPGCSEPVLREIDDEMISQVEIAHIHALNEGGSRYEEYMTDDQRNSYKNLILLCIPHHKLVDRKSNEPRFPASTLFAWKREREGAQLDALRSIAHLTPDKFEEMLINSVAATKNELLEAIDALPDRIDARIIKTLKQMAEQEFQQPRLHLEAIDELGRATWRLQRMGFPDMVQQFRGVVDRFETAARRLPEY